MRDYQTKSHGLHQFPAQKINRLGENMAVADIVLSTDDINEIDTAFAAIPVHGECNPAQMQKMAGK